MITTILQKAIQRFCMAISPISHSTGEILTKNIRAKGWVLGAGSVIGKVFLSESLFYVLMDLGLPIQATLWSDPPVPLAPTPLVCSPLRDQFAQRLVWCGFAYTLPCCYLLGMPPNAGLFFSWKHRSECSYTQLGIGK